MTTGSPSALEELQSLRDFGRIIAYSDPPTFLLRWSDDGQILSYGESLSLSMMKYRSLASRFISRAEELCDNLMRDLHPDIDLTTLKDDIVNTRYGFSFVQHPQNNLAGAYLELFRKACTPCRGGLFTDKGWDWKAIFQYERRVDTLVEMLAGGLYTACGQLPRASELLSLECTNGSATLRGIYAWDGYLIYVIRHHKAKRITNREFVVARFLPVQLGQSMYKYLVYIRPFLDMLQRERALSGLAQPSTLLFRAGNTLGKPWPSTRFTALLKRATNEVWGQPVNLQLFRQLSIGITEKHVREVRKPFNQFDDKGLEADLNVVFAWQSGHRPLQRGTTYGLDGAFPNRMQPALLRAYEWASTRWHEFLHLPSRVMPDPTAAIAERGLRSLSPQLREPPQSTTDPSLKRRALPSPEDGFETIRSIKRRALRQLDPSDVNNIQCSYTQQTAKHPCLADIIDRIEEWNDGGNLVSGEEYNSLSYWEGPDLIRSDVSINGSQCSLSRSI